jgi:hypothetical protein
MPVTHEHRPQAKNPLFCLLNVVFGLFVFALFLGGTRVANADNGAAQVSKVVDVFWGIISYTRWPDETKALRLCLPENNNQANLIRESARSIKFRRPVLIRTTPPDIAEACDVVYFSSTSGGEAVQSLQKIEGAPILTIGEGRTFCSVNGMFCLLFSGKDDGIFSANLHVISRSSLRVNPQVLRLSEHKRRQ